MRFRPSFRYLAAALLAGLRPIAVFGAARAQTIDNTANAQLGFRSTGYETESNLVTIDVETSDVFITVYRPTTGTGVPLDYRPALCSSTDFRGGTPAGGTRTATVQRTTVISAGNELFFEISAPLAKLGPTAIDQLDATLVSSTGDRETITIYETGENTGIFVGSVVTSRLPPSMGVEDCRLGVIDRAPSDRRLAKRIRYLHRDRRSWRCGAAAQHRVRQQQQQNSAKKGADPC